MTPVPRFADVRYESLTTQEDVLQRVSALLGRANTRQVWLMFLDDQGRQLPLIMPSYAPPTPRSDAHDQLARFFRAITDEAEAATLIVTYERRGKAQVTDADRLWLDTLTAACRRAEVDFIGPFLCHSAGVVATGDD